MKILIAYDGSACADAAVEDLRYAGLPREDDVLVVSVAHAGWPPAKHAAFEEGPFPSPWNACMKETELLAERARAHVQFQFPAWKVSSEALWGDPANILRKTILRWSPDLVVMGSHGRSAVGRLLLGSVSLDVVHHVPCSVRVVRGLRMANDPLRLLIANDGSAEAMAVVDAVARRSWPEGTQARVVSIAETLMSRVPVLVPALEGNAYASDEAFEVAGAADAREQARLRSVADECAERLQIRGLDVSAAVLEGHPRGEVLAEANRWRADTVFVGARGLNALDRFLLGSVSTAVVAHAHCTVEVIRQS